MSTCSYTGLNGNCTIVIDRAAPAAPPTIYSRHGSTVTLTIINSSPFEQLSMDFSSAKAVIPTDSFQTFMSAQSGTLQKLSIVDLSIARVGGGGGPQDTLDKISHEQASIYSDFDLGRFYPELAQVITANIPISACRDALAHVAGAGSSAPPAPNPWYNLDDWKQATLKEIGSDPKGGLVDIAQANAQLRNIDSKISQASQEIAGLSAGEQAQLKPYMDVVNQNQSALKARTDLVAWVTNLSKIGPRTFPLTDISRSARDWVQETWNLDATNTAGPVAKRVATAPYKPAQSGDVILNPAPKQSLMTVTVQYQSAPRVEFSAGLAVPVRPFHSFAVAAIASNGAITGNVVQESQTYTVIPMALVNLSLRQGIAHGQPAAGFVSFGTGYNPATSNVEFGVGGTFSWKSVQIGILADIGRDLRLAGGFTVGETLPASNPPKPLTTTFWSVRPAISLSVRIPVTGAGK